MAKALSASQVLSAKKNTLEFSGNWKTAIGNPEVGGSWIMWGQSFNGKTSFMLQLCKYLCGFEPVLLNSLEEGVGRSMQIALKRNKMDEVKRFAIVEGESTEELIERLSKKKSPRIIVTDSVQYADITYKEYKDLKRRFPHKLFIFVSHAEGKLPDGRVANKIRYDAMVKIRVEGYRAFVNSRYSENNGESNYITIWNEGASRYWGEKQQEK
ncbi:MAG: hypothetical protein BGO30_07380 [Bacteroidetes bacterium 41-46]|nr:MAG: hypothetical protein BGO30_07380 [Bacteroidetes bacterium 41-46]